MLKRIYFMKRVSLICTILQFIYFSTSLLTQNIIVICYMPILWCINTFIYALNFVRSRNALINIYTRKKIVISSPTKSIQQNIIALVNMNDKPPVALTRAKTACTDIILEANTSAVHDINVEPDVHYELKKSASHPVFSLTQNDTESADATTPLVESPDSIQIAT
eukprot:529797_1